MIAHVSAVNVVHLCLKWRRDRELEVGIVSASVFEARGADPCCFDQLESPEVWGNVTQSTALTHPKQPSAIHAHIFRPLIPKYSMSRVRRRGNGTTGTSVDVISSKVQQSAAGACLTQQPSSLESQLDNVRSDTAGNGKLAGFEGKGRTVGSGGVQGVSPHIYSLFGYSQFLKQGPSQHPNHNGPERLSSEVSGDVVQSIMKNPAISTYTDRFGHVHVINILCAPEVLPVEGIFSQSCLSMDCYLRSKSLHSSMPLKALLCPMHVDQS